MHLIAATPGAIEDGKEPVDLGQSPADVVVLSSSTTRPWGSHRHTRPSSPPLTAISV